jgi:hypothetical protein
MTALLLFPAAVAIITAIGLREQHDRFAATKRRLDADIAFMRAIPAMDGDL